MSARLPHETPGSAPLTPEDIAAWRRTEQRERDRRLLALAIVLFVVVALVGRCATGAPI